MKLSAGLTKVKGRLTGRQKHKGDWLGRVNLLLEYEVTYHYTYPRFVPPKNGTEWRYATMHDLLAGVIRSSSKTNYRLSFFGKLILMIPYAREKNKRHYGITGTLTETIWKDATHAYLAFENQVTN